MSYDFDLFVIGAGSGGVRAARTAAKHGIRVAIAEEKFMGGTCVNVGCVPKKLLTYAGNFSHAFTDSQGYGWHVGNPTFNWQTLIENKNTEIARLNDIYQKLLQDAGVEVITGRAKCKNNTSVTVDGIEYTAKRILLTCGSTPYIPDIEGAELASTSFDAFYLQDLPKRVVIVGGGYIAVEFASIFNGLGAKVTQLIRKKTILSGFDTEIAHFLMQQMQRQGINIMPTLLPTKLQKKGATILVHTDADTVLEADFVLFATGRIPYTKDLGLENTDVQIESNGSIAVNDCFQSNVKSIYALGDVINRVQLTPVALREAMIFVNQVYGDKTQKMSYDNIPTAIFSDPNVSTCGLSEQQAREKNFDIDVYTSVFSPLKNTLSGNPIKCLFKLIVQKKSGTVLGAHMVGNDAAEIMQGLGIAIKAGLKKADFDATIGIHPSSAEEFVTLSTPVR